nr:MAG TPA: hypothetical protein [Caudoviricetes sp.]
MPNIKHFYFSFHLYNIIIFNNRIIFELIN